MNFARLNTNGSDEIIDDEGPLSPPTNLGKRDRISPVKEEQAATRRTRPVRFIQFYDNWH